MNDSILRKFDKFQRQDVYMKDSAADFPKNSSGDRAAVALAAVIAEMQTLDAQQTSGFDDKRQAYETKANALDVIDDLLEQMSLAAVAIGETIEGFEEKFRLPRKLTQAVKLAKARSFLADAPPHEAEFIAEGLDDDFLAQLQAAIPHFEETAAAADSAEELHAGATGALNNAAGRGMLISKRLDAAVRLKYRDNSAKLAAWTVASHLDRAPQRAKQSKAAKDTPEPDEEK